MNAVPISVVVPAYGRPEYLREALESVARQTATPAETIVVDDASPDDAIRRVATESGARYIRRATNGGVAAARNTGIAAAREPWIALLDADDRWLPEKLERQYAVAAAHAAVGAIFCDFTYFDDAGPAKTTALAVNRGYAASAREPIAEDVVILRGAVRGLATEMYLQSSSLLLRRELARALGYDESLRYCEDFDFALRLAGRTAIACIERSLTEYRWSGDGLSAHESAMRLGDLALIERARSDPDRYGAATPALRARTHRALFLLAVAHLRAGRRLDALRSGLRSIRTRPTIRGAAIVALAALGRMPPTR